ncbi:MBL fold metallo-hydrolase [Cohnella rhizosphaerae]|uniref:MBL fold metallo-hydrolase n=1 Tax=Cohnella rhizosphaerae TaxID=1457232 RepID=A0A9X4L148_9BACL|nr:MBL fold metallo-hydrolase [Cohnella rhizosphaerae]MDG0814298.1 MBL fold metallo-hydrolase [Cohnella rhizosphaerae]
MKITTRASVHQLSFLPRFFPVNAYFVEEKNGLTLIDAALPYSAKGIIDAAARMGKPIRRILLTHAHSDHIGALDRLKSALPDAEVLISARDARLLAGDKSLDAGEPASPIRGGVPKPGAIRTRPDTLLADGDRIGSLLAVATPGHTPGSMSFLDTRTGALIVGDAFQVKGGMAVSGKMQPLFPFPAMATWSAAEAIRSAKRLVGLKPTLLAVGHGRMIADPIGAMNASVSEAERRLASQDKGGASHVTANRP